jgi:hypothetical protein
MARRQRRDPLEKHAGELVGFIGLIVFACVFVPGVRAVLSGILVFLLIGLGIAILALIIWAIYRHYRRQETEYTAAYLGTPSGSGAQEDPALRAVKTAVARTEAEIKAAGQPQTSTFFSLRRSPIESEGDDGLPLHGYPTALSKELLDALEWRRFEELVTWYFQKTGLEAKRSRVGADGGVDILLSRPDDAEPFAYVQCKAWHQYKVGIKPVRELFGVMASDKIPSGFFVTTGEFTEEAVRFVQGKEMTLMAGHRLLTEINALPESDRSSILQRVTAGDYTTPTCPRCDLKMVRRTGSSGDFWGCINYSKRPSCRQTFKMREG